MMLQGCMVRQLASKFLTLSLATSASEKVSTLNVPNDLQSPAFVYLPCLTRPTIEQYVYAG